MTLTAPYRGVTRARVDRRPSANELWLRALWFTGRAEGEGDERTAAEFGRLVGVFWPPLPDQGMPAGGRT